MAEEPALNELLEESGVADTLQDADDTANKKSGKFNKLNFTKPTWIKIGVGIAILVLLLIATWWFMSRSDSIDDVDLEDTDDLELIEPLDDAVDINDMGSTSSANILDPITDTASSSISTEAKQLSTAEPVTKPIAPVDTTVLTGNEKLTNKRLMGISSSMVTSGQDNTSSAINPDASASNDQPQQAPSSTNRNDTQKLIELQAELAAVKADNATLQQKVASLTAELKRKEYLQRTNEIINSQYAPPVKQKIEKPLHIELEPKWGSFNSTQPAGQ